MLKTTTDYNEQDTHTSKSDELEPPAICKSGDMGNSCDFCTYSSLIKIAELDNGIVFTFFPNDWCKQLLSITDKLNSVEFEAVELTERTGDENEFNGNVGETLDRETELCKNWQSFP